MSHLRCLVNVEIALFVLVLRVPPFLFFAWAFPRSSSFWYSALPFFVMIETLCYEAMLLSVEFVYCQRRSYTLPALNPPHSYGSIRVNSSDNPHNVNVWVLFARGTAILLFVQQLSLRMSRPICGSSPSTSLWESCCPMRKQNGMCRNMHAFSASDKKLCGIFFLSDINYCNELDCCNSQERRYSVESV